MRRADDCLARLSGCKYFTSVDLRAGFWQMDIHPDDRPLLAFRSHSAHLQFTCLPMGLSASSGAFQRMSEFLCQGLVDNADGESHDSSGPVLNGVPSSSSCHTSMTFLCIHRVTTTTTCARWIVCWR